MNIHKLLALIMISLLTACQMPVKPNIETPKPQETSSSSEASSPEQAVSAIEPAKPEQTIAIETSAATTTETTDEDMLLAGDRNKQIGAVVFKRLRKDFSGPVCNSTAAVNQWKKRYIGGNPRAFSKHLGEILPLLDYVSLEVERRNLPAEFALIPIIESWYRPQAIGAGGPAGLWQMIGTTAKNHGIKIQAGYDGRFSVVDSTDAALSYLGSLQGMFKDWQRAVMGYNAGEFRILRAIKKSGTKSEGQDHWPYGLSPITYAYIAKIQALSCLIAEPEKNNLSLPNSSEFIPLSAILLESHLNSMDEVAKHYRIDADKIKEHNPAYRNAKISAQAPRRILLPSYLAKREFQTMRAETKPNNQATEGDVSQTGEAHNGSHQVKNGETLWSIAKRYGLAIENLRKLNGLERKSVLRVGQHLKLAP
jgi:membrane-bound lytic murein transglycosylase D